MDRSTKQQPWLGLIGAFVVALVTMPSAVADPAVEVDVGDVVAFWRPGFLTVGWEFIANTDIEVTDLGWYDFGTAGFSAARDIGIWDSAGSLLTSSGFPAGTSATLLDGARYVSIVPLSLVAGSTYIIGGTLPQGPPGSEEDTAIQVVSLAVAPEIVYVGGRFVVGPASLTFPSSFLLFNPPNFGAGLFGPNFLFTRSPVMPIPEPCALFLVVLGTVGILRRAGGRRRH